MSISHVTGANDVDGLDLLALLTDEDRNVRLAAVLSLPPAILGLAAFDPDPVVRFAVAERIAETKLALFLDDAESLVRQIACSRLTAASERHVSRLMGENQPVMSVDALAKEPL